MFVVKNMDRYRFYSILGVINLIFFLLSLVLGFQDIAGIFSFIVFLGFVMYLLFSIEEPPVIEKLKIVEVHKVYRAKQNNLNIVLSMEFVFLSLLFGILILYFNFSLAVTVALLWLVSIPILSVTINRLSKTLLVNNIVNYALLLYPSLEKNNVESIILKFVKENTLDRDELIKQGNNDILFQNLADAYIKYMSALPLTKGEIEEINDL